MPNHDIGAPDSKPCKLFRRILQIRICQQGLAFDRPLARFGD